MDRKPRLLFLAQRIPYPPDKGEKIRYLQVLRHLALHHEVHLGCLIDDPADVAHISAIDEICADAYFARLHRRWAKIICLRGLLTGTALSVAYFRDRGLAQWVARVLRDIRPEVIFVCSSNMAGYVLDAGFRGRVRLVDLCDVDSEKWRAYAEEGPAWMRWLHRREWRLVAALEARIARDCDWSTFVSPQEAALFTRLVPGSQQRVRAIANGVDHAYFDPAGAFEAPYDTARPNYVFTGTMDYPPNIDAVLWFVAEILPLIRQEKPQAQFHVVGSNPAPQVRALTAIPGVFVTGRVGDVRPHVAHATAAVAPMRIARGIQNKVLEAMAMARPVVVTPQALEGIDAVPSQEVLMAMDANSFAAACLHALSPEALHIGAAARLRVMADYSWPSRLRGFDSLLDPSDGR